MKKKPAGRAANKRILRLYRRPMLDHRKLAEIGTWDITEIHVGLRNEPAQANRTWQCSPKCSVWQNARPVRESQNDEPERRRKANGDRMGKCGESLWRIEDLAEYLAISAGEVQELVDLIGIPHLKISKHLRFRRADIDRWLDSLKSPSMDQDSVPASGPMFSLADVERRKSDSRRLPPYNPKPTQQWYQPPYQQPQRIEVPQKTTTSYPDVRVSEYRDLQGYLGALGEINGFRVTLDQPIPEEETPIEAALERDAWKLACLILLSLPVDKDVLKIKRCLSSGFDEAAIVFASRKHVHQGEPLITQNLAKEELARVHLLAPDELSSYIEGITTLVSEKTDFTHGYKVRVRYYRTNPADQERRKKALSKIIADNILRQRIAAMRDS